VQAVRLLRNANIKQAVADKLAIVTQKNEITADWVVDRAKKIVERCTQAEPVLDREGKPIGVYKFDSAGANGSLKILAKYLGMEKSTLKVDLPGMTLIWQDDNKDDDNGDDN